MYADLAPTMPNFTATCTSFLSFTKQAWWLDPVWLVSLTAVLAKCCLCT